MSSLKSSSSGEAASSRRNTTAAEDWTWPAHDPQPTRWRPVRRSQQPTANPVPRTTGRRREEGTDQRRCYGRWQHGGPSETATARTTADRKDPPNSSTKAKPISFWDLVIGWWRCVRWIDWLSWLEQWEMVFIYQSPRPYLNNHHKQTKWASLVVKQRRCGWTEPPQTTQEHSGGEETTGNCLHGPHLGLYIIANGLRFGSFSSFNWWPSWWKCLENINIFFWVVDIGLLNTWFTIATIKCCNSWSNIGSSSSDSLQIWGEILKNPQKSDLEFKRLWTFVTGWSLIRWSRQKVSEIIFD